MNAQNNQAQAYVKTGAYSGTAYADPASLITQMFDGALTRIAQAKGAIQRKDIAAKGTDITRAVAIIGCLEGCLDLEKGGDIAANLSSLYNYMNIKLSEANIYNDTSKLDEVSKLILEIKSAWVQIQ